MNMMQIDYFLMVVDSGSFTAAAQKLYVSQPAVSRIIAALEGELGCTLFDRSERKAVTLTPAGKLYCDCFRHVRQYISDTMQAVQSLNNTTAGSIYLGIRNGLNLPALIPALLERFSQNYPNIDLQICTYDFQEMRTALLDRRIDVSINTEDSLFPLKDLETQLITESPRIMLYAAKHPLAAKEGLVPADFRDTPFLAVDDVQAELRVQQYCQDYGFKPKVIFVPNVESMLDGVQNLQGVAIMDSTARARTNTEFRHIQLNSFNRIVLAWLSYCANPLLPILKTEIMSIVGGTQKQKSIGTHF